jgi:integrase
MQVASSQDRAQGWVVPRGRLWEARWINADGARRSKTGFRLKTDARNHARAESDLARRVRAGLALIDPFATVDELVDTFLEKHGRTIDPATRHKLATQLKHARKEFGTRRPDSLCQAEIEDWRQCLPAGSRHDVFRAFRQALAWAAARGFIARDATVGIKNPKRRREERRDVLPFESWAEVEAVAAELDQRYAAIPVFAVATGLRPEEWIGLHRADVDRSAGVVNVRRRCTGGLVKQGTKTGAKRVVPLQQRALDALASMPARIDSPILFPAPRGGYIDIEKFRYREWSPAFRAAGIDHRRIYDMRHTFATWAIGKGVPTLTLAQIMGTSVTQLEDTYVRWLRSDAERVRAILDTKEAVNV